VQFITRLTPKESWGLGNPKIKARTDQKPMTTQKMNAKHPIKLENCDIHPKVLA
jgi:hypothetical protein